MCFLYSAVTCWRIPSDRPMTIGRQDDNSIVIKDRFVSMLHCRIEAVTGQKVLIRDLNSRNGTFVNGRKVDVLALKDGDRINIASHVFWFSDNQTDLIVDWRDRLQIWLVRKQKWVRVFLALLPLLVILGESYRGTISDILNLLLELIQ